MVGPGGVRVFGGIGMGWVGDFWGGNGGERGCGS